MTCKPVVGVTMGDPSGVGPEIILKALQRQDVRDAANYVVYGAPEAMRRAAPVATWQGIIQERESILACTFPDDGMEVIRCGTMSPGDCETGRVSAASGGLAFNAIRIAIEDALAGSIDATATAPINKESLSLAGHRFAGHTEIYARYTGTSDYTMMLMDGPLRVVHVSTHVSLREAIDRVKKDRIVSVIRLVREALVGMGINTPRIAVAGLNPHAGENGLFGTEEIEEIAPAVKEASALGATGPYPPDSIFSRATGGEFDAVVAMYHDQGHIPLKMAGFRFGDAGATSIAGINITRGTPVIRCSVDHGTAFDIAGKGLADPGSMAMAMITAAGMA
ncbi:MAG: 4-hydroxythreonine-4-phosphate dehydrogenase PdxA, partial [Spirochaetota bacterium]